MFDDIEIRYYRESDVFYSESREYINFLYHVPKFITNLLGVSGDFLSTKICYPYTDDNDIFDYDELKKNKNYINDKIVIVAVKKNKVIGICIFTIYEKYVYLKLFCIEVIIRKSGFGKHFIESCMKLLKRNTELPLVLVSTEEGHNFYKKVGFRDIEYNTIRNIDTAGKLKWTKIKDQSLIGKYLMKYYERKYNKNKKIRRSKKITRL